MIPKFDGLEPRGCEAVKGIVAPENDPKRLGFFEKQTPGDLRKTNSSEFV